MQILGIYFKFSISDDMKPGILHFKLRLSGWIVLLGKDRAWSSSGAK